MMTPKSPERIPKTSLMKVKIVRTLTKIWMAIWCPGHQEQDQEILICLLKGVELSCSSMLDLEQLYLPKTCRIVA